MTHKKKTKFRKLATPSISQPCGIKAEGIESPNSTKNEATSNSQPKESQSQIRCISDYSFFNKAMSSLFLILLCVAIIRVILLLDFDKRVFNHKPGVCRVVHNLVNGTSHMEYVSHQGILFVTQPPPSPSPSYYSLLIPSKYESEGGSIFVLNLPKESTTKLENFAATKLRIEIQNTSSSSASSSTFNRSTFYPLGISSTVFKDRITLYVVNGNPSKNTIEVFSYSPKPRKLIHLKTVSDDSFQSLKDVHAFGGGERLLLINSFYFKKALLQSIEIGLQINSGNLMFFDGKTTKIIDKSIAFPTSIAVDNERNFVYVSSYTSEVIKRYKIQKDFTVTANGEIPLMSSPNQIFIEAKSGDIWIAAQPVFYRTFNFLNAFSFSSSSNATTSSSSLASKAKAIPSHILRVRFQENKDSWVITEPYSNDGKMISAASSLALINENLFALGGGKGKTFICQINNFLLA